MAALKPIADASVGNWVGTNPANLYGNLDEDTADAGDAIRSGSLPDTCKLQMAAPTTLDNGLYVDYVLGAIGAAPIKAQVRLYDGALLKASWTHDPVPQTQTPFSQFVPASTLVGANPANLFVEFARMTPTTTAQRLDSYTLSPSTINLGDSAALSWATSNAFAPGGTGVQINGADVPPDGTQSVNPDVTTNYTIIVSGSAANISSSRLLTVLPTGGGGAGEVESIPPETILINSEGNWTISPGGTLTLNGVAMSAGGVSLVEKYNDAIMWRSTPGGEWSTRLYDPSQGSPPPRTGSTLFEAEANVASVGALLDADDLPFIGPSNTPDIWLLELTDAQAIIDRCKYTPHGGNDPFPTANPYNKEFLIDPTYGFPYMRFTNNPNPNANDGLITYPTPAPSTVNGTALMSWYMPLGDGNIGDPQNDREQVNIGWLFYFEEDAKVALNEDGLKLSGLENNDGFNGYPLETSLASIGWIYPPIDENQWSMRLVRYDATAPYQQGSAELFFRPNRWYWIEIEQRLNTPNVADGYAALYINGHKRWENDALLMRTESHTKMRTFRSQVYHGGVWNPLGVFHCRQAHMCASTSYIGVPDFMFSSSGGTFPAWRSEAWAVDTLQYIPDTEEMNGDMQLAPGSLQTYGRSSLDLEVWTGMANDGNAVMYGVAMGGHMWGWCNKAWKVDFSEDEPRCNLMGWGTPETNYLGGSVGGDYVPSLAEMNEGAQLVHYNDESTHPLGSKRPSARQNYYASHYNGVMSPPRIFLIGTEAGFGGNAVTKGNIEAWNLGTNDYDVAGVWGNLPEPLFSAAPSVLVKAIARHPTTQSIYVTLDGKWAKMRPNGTWFVFSASNQSNGLWYHYFQFHGTCIDPVRHRFACLEGGPTRGIPLGIQYVGIAAIEDESSNVTTGHAIALQGDAQGLIDLTGENNGGSALVYDPDNDRYVALWGDVSFGRPARAYAIHPDDGTVTLLDEFTGAPVNGFQGRAAYLAALGGIATVWRWDSPIAFLPTRTSP